MVVSTVIQGTGERAIRHDDFSRYFYYIRVLLTSGFCFKFLSVFDVYRAIVLLQPGFAYIKDANVKYNFCNIQYCNILNSNLNLGLSEIETVWEGGGNGAVLPGGLQLGSPVTVCCHTHAHNNDVLRESGVHPSVRPPSDRLPTRPTRPGLGAPKARGPPRLWDKWVCGPNLSSSILFRVVGFPRGSSWERAPGEQARMAWVIRGGSKTVTGRLFLGRPPLKRSRGCFRGYPQNGGAILFQF
jgi:hypothetical protein